LPFLRRVRRIELRREGRPMATFRREPHDNRVVLHGPGEEVLELQRLTGNFDIDAGDLRRRPDAPIEDKRSSRVEVLVSDQLDEGRLYAVLPTAERLPARMLICADFFPHSSRRTINLEQGVRAEWNRAAVRAAGRLLADHLDELPGRTGVVPTWRLIESVHKTSLGAVDESFKSLWESLRPAVESEPIAPATDGVLDAVRTRLFVSAPADDDANDVLSALGAHVLAPGCGSSCARCHDPRWACASCPRRISPHS
jgi:hypothetical protein